jgi:hypothetical protein
MKKTTFVILLVFHLNLLCAQNKSYAFYELYQLDSLSNASSPGRYFGGLYYDFLLLVEKKLENADTSTRRLVRHFEQVFARFYIEACDSFAEGRQVPLPAWRQYFSNTGLSRSQYYLLGANAHLNGGLAEAIAGSYSPAEWKRLKKEYGLFNSCLNETLSKVYAETLVESGRARSLSFVTLGLTKPLSNYYLYKWRKRQMRLTEYYYQGDTRFSLLEKKIRKRKSRVDRMIIKNIR